jgi:hypothetical protein
MPVINNWWLRQLMEGMREASRLLDGFKEATQPNIEDLDQALAIHEEYCQAYDLEEITFKEFTDYGKSLRARQTRLKIQMDYDHE